MKNQRVNMNGKSPAASRSRPMYPGTVNGALTAPGSKRQKSMPRPSAAIAPKQSGPIARTS